MKMLVCVDGSKQSMKAVEEAIKIAGGCSISDISLLYVYESSMGRFPWVGEEQRITAQDIERFKKILEQDKEKHKEVLANAKKPFTEHNMDVQTIFEEGHPADTIVRVANEGEYDMVVLGSRGLGGLKKLLLGSVSSAVIQEVKSNVVVVK